ncbi:MAG: DUF2897 family protein [Idiomarina sp.]|nr:DUF2897 family protein [Idiomarina sp.]
MPTWALILLIVFALGMILSPVMLLRKTAHWKMPAKRSTPESDQDKDNDDWGAQDWKKENWEDEDDTPKDK